MVLDLTFKMTRIITMMFGVTTIKIIFIKLKSIPANRLSTHLHHKLKQTNFHIFRLYLLIPSILPITEEQEQDIINPIFNKMHLALEEEIII